MQRRRWAAVLATLGLVTSLFVAVPSAQAAAPNRSTRVLLAQLQVATEHPAGYDRSLFPLWTDSDGDGCNTRYEVLIAEATRRPTIGSGCSLSGGRWFSVYDGVSTTDPSTFDVDHVVPLAEAWQSGAWNWNTDTRTRYANDLGYAADLVAVTAHSNRSKGDREPAGWSPPRASFRCRYYAWWVAVKWRWQLAVNPTEKVWLRNHLAACGWPLVRGTTQPPIG